MNHHMNENPNTNSNTRIWLILVAIIVVVLAGILAAFWAVSTFFYPFSPFGRPPPPNENPFDYEFFYIAQTVVSTINVMLSILLLLIYVSIYRKTRSEFTIGLIVFSAVFLLNALAADPLVIRAFGYHPVGLGPFALLPDLFTFGALSVLLYLSVKY
jgi:hypothetical protein